MFHYEKFKLSINMTEKNWNTGVQQNQKQLQGETEQIFISL